MYDLWKVTLYVSFNGILLLVCVPALAVESFCLMIVVTFLISSFTQHLNSLGLYKVMCQALRTVRLAWDVQQNISE